LIGTKIREAHTGIGTAPDLEKAKYWLKLAADQGDEEAKQELNNL
jgi:TPR repeat protein